MTTEPSPIEPTPAAEIAEPTPPAANRSGGKRGCLFEIIETLVLTVLIFLGIQTFVAQPFKIEGGSMETTLLEGEYVLIDKLTPRWATYELGDIVVLDPPGSTLGSNGTPFIKRVIGVAGDRIELKNGKVFVNGTVISEPYLFARNGVAEPTDPSPGGLSEWLVPEDEVFVMGDHRQNSADSRQFGPVEISHVIGRAWLRYWPIDTFGLVAP